MMVLVIIDPMFNRFIGEPSINCKSTIQLVDAPRAKKFSTSQEAEEFIKLHDLNFGHTKQPVTIIQLKGNNS